MSFSTHGCPAFVDSVCASDGAHVRTSVSLVVLPPAPLAVVQVGSPSLNVAVLGLTSSCGSAGEGGGGSSSGQCFQEASRIKVERVSSGAAVSKLLQANFSSVFFFLNITIEREAKQRKSAL